MGGVDEAVRARIAERIARGPFGEMLEMRAERIEADRVSIRLPWRHAVTNGGGIVHGGAISALIDTAGTAAAWALPAVGEGARGATVGLSVNFMAPGRDGDLVAEARVVSRGRRIVVIDVDVTDPRGTAVAKGLVTYNLNPGEAAPSATATAPG